MTNKAHNKIVQEMLNSRKVRVNISKESHFWFSSVYLADYVRYETANFQKELFKITEDEKTGIAVVVAFRGSAKSTIMTLSYPLWAILGEQQKKFILILSQTQSQAKLHLSNIRKELEGNQLLKQEMGPFEEKTAEWGSTSIVIPKHDARITVASSEQSIRGIRHGSHRPDLIVCDDVEDLNSVKTREGRNKTYDWFTSEVIPTGDNNTKIIVVGNLLHEDSLLMRLKEGIENGRLGGIYREYPLVNEQGQILWPGKFKGMEEIDKLKLTVPNENAWQREFMLRIVPEEDQLIFPEWLNYYDSLPPKDSYRYVATAVDLAISEKDTADYTAMVSAYIGGIGEDIKIYILPRLINKRMDFPTAVQGIKDVHNSFVSSGISSKVYIEDVGYQASMIHQLRIEGVNAEGVKPHGQDKRSRLALTTSMIQRGQVVFPRQGADELIEQLVGFGKEKHDDLADAFSMLINKTIERNRFMPGILVAG
jgi:predicted phage terminase large subunit-like protein